MIDSVESVELNSLRTCSAYLVDATGPSRTSIVADVESCSHLGKIISPRLSPSPSRSMNGTLT